MVPAASAMGGFVCVIVGIALLAQAESSPSQLSQTAGVSTASAGAGRVARTLANAPLKPRTLADSLNRGRVSCADLRGIGQATRPTTGHAFRGGRYADANELVVQNQSGRDAIVRIRNAGLGQVVRTVYVRTGTTGTIQQIPDGTYEVIFMFGEDWIPKLGRFCAKQDFSRFDDLFDYHPRVNRYNVWDVTLHSVVGGTAETSPVDPAAFAGISQ
jgi:hypothetical protein